MIRGILRNVQFYFLFAAVLLVMLAFQRMQWYNQGFLTHSHYFIDGTELTGGLRAHKRSTDSSNSGEDAGGGIIYYGGDESKEIGLFKFRVGLFKFVFPTFSNEPSSWSQSNGHYLTVPPPPNADRNNKAKEGGSNGRMRSFNEYATRKNKNGTKQRGNKIQEKENPSVAYVIIIPSILSSQKQKSNYVPNYRKEKKSPRRTCAFQDRAAVLSKSIAMAHDNNSQYDYQMYAIHIPFSSNQIFEGGQQNMHNDDNLEQCTDALLQLGYKIIDVNEFDLDTASSTRNDSMKNIHTMLGQHEIVVQTSLDSFSLKPMNDLYDILLLNNLHTSSLRPMGVRDMGKNLQGSTSQVDSFALENLNIVVGAKAHESVATTTSYVKENELFVFKTSSKQTMDLYSTLLKCAASSTKRAGKSEEETPCSIQVKNSLGLDRCMYDAGSVNCEGYSRVPVKQDVRFARFATAGDVNVSDRNSNAYRCTNPSECASAESCIRSSLYADKRQNNAREEFCVDLHRQWFNFAEGSLVDNVKN